MVQEFDLPSTSTAAPIPEAPAADAPSGPPPPGNFNEAVIAVIEAIVEEHARSQPVRDALARLKTFDP